MRNLKRTCLLCDKAVDPAYRPFCGWRCADDDLTRWLQGAYRLRVTAGPESSTGEDVDV